MYGEKHNVVCYLNDDIGTEVICTLETVPVEIVKPTPDGPLHQEYITWQLYSVKKFDGSKYVDIMDTLSIEEIDDLEDEAINTLCTKGATYLFDKRSPALAPN